MNTIPQLIQTWTRTAGAALVMTLLLCAAPSLNAADKAGDAAYEAAAGLFNLAWKQASESYKSTLPNTHAIRWSPMATLGWACVTSTLRNMPVPPRS